MAGDTPFEWVDSSSTKLTAANLNRYGNMSQYNRVENGSLEVWTSAPLPCGWSESGGGTVTKESTITYVQHGTYSAKIAMLGGAAHYLYREIVSTSKAKATGYNSFCGRTLTLSAKVYATSILNPPLIYFSDGYSTFESSALDEAGTWKTLSVSGTCASYGGSSQLVAGIKCPSGTYNTWADEFCLVDGSVARPFVPNFRDVSASTELSSLYNKQLHHIMIFDPVADASPFITWSGVPSGSWTAYDPPASASWATDSALAVLLRVKAIDSACAEAGPVQAYVEFRKKNDTTTTLRVPASPNSLVNEQQVWVGLDDGGEFEYKVSAGSGSSFSGNVWGVAYLRPL